MDHNDSNTFDTFQGRLTLVREKSVTKCFILCFSVSFVGKYVMKQMNPASVERFDRLITFIWVSRIVIRPPVSVLAVPPGQRGQASDSLKWTFQYSDSLLTFKSGLPKLIVDFISDSTLLNVGLPCPVSY